LQPTLSGYISIFAMPSVCFAEEGVRAGFGGARGSVNLRKEEASSLRVNPHSFTSSYVRDTTAVKGFLHLREKMAPRPRAAGYQTLKLFYPPLGREQNGRNVVKKFPHTSKENLKP
jgi:hypothetical protein